MGDVSKVRQWVSEYKFAGILKIRIFPGEQICFALGKFTLLSKHPQTEIHLF